MLILTKNYAVKTGQPQFSFLSKELLNRQIYEKLLLLTNYIYYFYPF